MTAPGPLLAILVGGQATRMGGVAKGLLSTPKRIPIIENTLRAFGAAAPNGSAILVGEADRTAAYVRLSLPVVGDDPPGIGPMGGIRSVLRSTEKQNRTTVIVGCDMPHLDSALFRKLLYQNLEAAAVAPRVDGRWQPLLSRLDPRQVLPVLDECLAAREHSLQRLLDRLSAAELVLSAEQLAQLGDWDSPDDVAADTAEKS